MSTSMNETTTPGMGHNEGPDFDALESRADSLAKRAWHDFELGKKHGGEGTATQRYTAAIMLHHKAIEFSTPLRTGLQRSAGKRGKAWDALLAMVVEKFHPDSKPMPPKGQKASAEVTNQQEAHKNKRTLVTTALSLACVFDSFGMDVETWFDDRAGLFRIDPQYMCKDGYRPHEPGKLLHLNGRKFIALQKRGSGIQKPNLSASQLIKMYDPKPKATGNAGTGASGKADSEATDESRGANVRNNAVVYDNFGDLLPKLREKMVSKNGSPSWTPKKIGNGENEITQAEITALSDVMRVGAGWFKTLKLSLPF
jgi:hypothetical protein